MVLKDKEGEREEARTKPFKHCGSDFCEQRGRKEECLGEVPDCSVHLRVPDFPLGALHKDPCGETPHRHPEEQPTVCSLSPSVSVSGKGMDLAQCWENSETLAATGCLRPALPTSNCLWTSICVLHCSLELPRAAIIPRPISIGWCQRTSVSCLLLTLPNMRHNILSLKCSTVLYSLLGNHDQRPTE